MTSVNADKTIRILLQHIDFVSIIKVIDTAPPVSNLLMCLQRKEFNVKVVHTKLSTPDDRLLLSNSYDPSTSDTAQDIPKMKALTPVREHVIKRLNVDMYIKEINIVLYDEDRENLHKKNEIVSVHLDDVLTCYSEEVNNFPVLFSIIQYHFKLFFFCEQNRNIEFGFRNIQIDNRLYSSGKFDFPVILCSQNDNRDLDDKQRDANRDVGDENISSSNALTPTPFSLHLTKSMLLKNQLGHVKITLELSIFSPKEIHCNLEPLRVYIEDKFIMALLDFAFENLPSNIIYTSPSNIISKRIVCDSGEMLVPRVVSDQILSFLLEPLRLDHVCIKPLSILLSVHTCMRLVP